MAVKNSKAIKKLKKQINKLKARIDDMNMQLKSLLDAGESTDTEQIAAKLQQPKPDSIFTEDEVEKASELAEDAEEIADILKKLGKGKKGKKGKK